MFDKIHQFVSFFHLVPCISYGKLCAITLNYYVKHTFSGDLLNSMQSLTELHVLVYNQPGGSQWSSSYRGRTCNAESFELYNNIFTQEHVFVILSLMKWFDITLCVAGRMATRTGRSGSWREATVPQARCLTARWAPGSWSPHSLAWTCTNKVALQGILLQAARRLRSGKLFF